MVKLTHLVITAYYAGGKSGDKAAALCDGDKEGRVSVCLLCSCFDESINFRNHIAMDMISIGGDSN